MFQCSNSFFVDLKSGGTSAYVLMLLSDMHSARYLGNVCVMVTLKYIR